MKKKKLTNRQIQSVANSPTKKTSVFCVDFIYHTYTMVLPKIFSIMLFVISFSHSVIGENGINFLQNNVYVCFPIDVLLQFLKFKLKRQILVLVSKLLSIFKLIVLIDPNDFPLFGTQCISRELYTGIFLASIMLAGISFLLLIVSAVNSIFRISTFSFHLIRFYSYRTVLDVPVVLVRVMSVMIYQVFTLKIVLNQVVLWRLHVRIEDTNQELMF